MGNYIDQADLAIAEDILIDLTDDAGVGVVDADVVTAAIADAEALADSYCAPRYLVPFTSAPAVIVSVVKRLAKQALYERRDHVPEAVQQGYKDAVGTLRDISAGRISLGEDTAPAAGSQSEGARVDKTSDDRVFTKTTMENF